jgi:lamin tail-like protein
VGLRLVCVVAVVSGCARGGSLPTPGEQADAAPNGQPPDAAAAPDAPAADAPAADAPAADAPPGGGSATSLILTEVSLAPAAGEFIEIANPTAQAVDLSTYYLADNFSYYKLPAGLPLLDTNDFIVKFPMGAMIPAKGVITVALDTTASFTTNYGVAPTFSIASGQLHILAMNGTPSLTNTGEIVVLFQWSGTTDVVHDVDIVIAGLPSAQNGFADKSNYAQDGPDADTATTAYKPDARSMKPQPAAPASGRSTKRVALETGHETQNGAGNGLDGDDETSEDTTLTWDEVFTVPTPGTVPAGLLP